MGTHFQLKISPEGIGELVFDMPEKSANILNLEALEELSDMIDGIEDNEQIKALVIKSGKKGIFIAGADLHGFEYVFNDRELAERLIGMGHAVFAKLGNLPFPTIAVIDGACLGGGMELALGCSYRVVTDNPKTKLGLPEVNLGLFPGWGGTQRTPRLVGVLQGMKLVLQGKPIDGKKAYKIHLADEIVAYPFVEEGTEKFVQKILSSKGKKQVEKRRKRPFFDKTVIGPLIAFWKAKRDILKKTKGHYPAPIAALELMRKTYFVPLQTGLKMERETFVDKISTDLRHAINLIHVFFNHEELKKNPGLPEGVEVDREVRNPSVIGAGTMGSGIGWLFSYRGYDVRMKDVNWDAVGSGMGSAWKTYKTLIRIRKLKPKAAQLKFHLLRGTVDYTGFQHSDLVIEAATEKLDLKYKIFDEVESVVPEDAVIASNTSSLTISKLAENAKHPERFVGMHFFNPASRMPLVEVVQGDKTSPEAVARAVQVCQKLKKTPIVVKDCAGFLVNRVFVMGLVGVMSILEEGAPMAKIEKVMLDFGMPMGPFTLADEVGNDVNDKVLQSFSEAYGERVVIPDIVKKMNDHELYGKKAGKGFYLYENGKKKGPNPEVGKLLPSEKFREVSEDEIIDRVILAMVAEAARCLEEGIVQKPGDLDTALILGTGFPPFRGGLLKYADKQGIPQVVEKMRKLQEDYGGRYEPCGLLVEMAEKKKTFY